MDLGRKGTDIVSTVTTLTPLFKNLCDDAALFPPGNAPLAEALPAHDQHFVSSHAELVGPFVFPAIRLDGLIDADIPTVHLPDGVLDISLTILGASAIAEAVATLARIDRTRLAAIEIVPAEAESATDIITVLEVQTFDVPVFVEVPRDGRRREFLESLSGTTYAAKFRTGGVVAEKYPDETELAAAIHTAVGKGIPFKTTAGMHHAIRNTDPSTGFEQHGFLNVLLATDRALDGADKNALVDVLADRDGEGIAVTLDSLNAGRQASIRRAFRSVGTCSVADPLEDLTTLKLIGR